MAWNSTCSEKKNIGKETNRPKKFIYFLLRTEEYFAFYRTLNRVYSIIIDFIILNNYIGAQNIRVTDEVIFFQVTDPGLRPHKCIFVVFFWCMHGRHMLFWICS